MGQFWNIWVPKACQKRGGGVLGVCHIQLYQRGYTLSFSVVDIVYSLNVGFILLNNNHYWRLTVDIVFQFLVIICCAHIYGFDHYIRDWLRLVTLCCDFIPVVWILYILWNWAQPIWFPWYEADNYFFLLFLASQIIIVASGY